MDSSSPLEAELYEQNSLLSDEMTNDLVGIMDSNQEDDYSNPKVNKRFQCIVCLKKFKNYELLQKHLKDVHTGMFATIKYISMKRKHLKINLSLSSKNF